MPLILEGELVAKGRFAIVVARYNESITKNLLDGAINVFLERGVVDRDITVAWVPGAWEIPVIAGQLARSRQFDAVVCLGAVIRGETTHDQYINQQVSHSLGDLAMELGIPILFGLLTCNSIEQAIHRSGGNVGNKGADCAEAALEMADLMRKLPFRTA